MSALKELTPKNIQRMSVTCNTSHFLIGPCGQLSLTKHCSTAILSRDRDFGENAVLEGRACKRGHVMMRKLKMSVYSHTTTRSRQYDESEYHPKIPEPVNLSMFMCVLLASVFVSVCVCVVNTIHACTHCTCATVAHVFFKHDVY